MPKFLGINVDPWIKQTTLSIDDIILVLKYCYADYPKGDPLSKKKTPAIRGMIVATSPQKDFDDYLIEDHYFNYWEMNNKEMRDLAVSQAKAWIGKLHAKTKFKKG